MTARRQDNWYRRLGARWQSFWWLKAIGITGSIAAFMPLYFLLQTHPQFAVTVVPLQPIDHWISLHPWALWPYVSLWLYIGMAPGLLWLHGAMPRYLAAVITLAVVGCLIFLFFPTQAPHFDIDWQQWPTLYFLKSADNDGNACPSLHVAFSVFTAVWLFRILRHVGAPRWLHLISLAWAGLIIWSTMAIRQHVALDVEMGTLLGLGVALAFIHVRPLPSLAPPTRLATPSDTTRPWPVAANRLWRQFATGTCFAVYAGIGWLGSLTVLPVLMLWPGSDQARQRRIRGVVTASFRCLLRVIALLRIGHVEVEGRQWLNEADGKLVVANHPMYLDVLVLLGLLPQADCVIKNAMWRNRFYHHFVRAIGYLSNASGPDLIAAGVARLKRGNTLILFPEGTRTTPEHGMHFSRGAAQLAVRSQCDILPVVIRCDPPALGKGQAWHDVPDRPWRLTVRVLPPLRLSELGWHADQPHGIAARHVSNRLEVFFAARVNADGQAHADLDDSHECMA